MMSLTAKRGSGRPPIYRLADKSRVPSSTTIAKVIDEPEGLIHWAWQLGVDGKDYKQERDAAGSAGHLAHALIEAFVHGEDERETVARSRDAGTPEDTIGLALQGLQSFQRWLDGNKLEVVNTETPLVSEQHRFGGTRDALLQSPDGIYAIGDWKSGGAVYPAHVIQVASYALLAEECENHPIDSLHIIRVGKEHANFVHVGLPKSVVRRGIQAFLRARDLYDDRSELKKLVR